MCMCATLRACICGRVCDCLYASAKKTPYVYGCISIGTRLCTSIYTAMYTSICLTHTSLSEIYSYGCDVLLASKSFDSHILALCTPYESFNICLTLHVLLRYIFAFSTRVRLFACVFLESSHIVLNKCVSEPRARRRRPSRGFHTFIDNIVYEKNTHDRGRKRTANCWVPRLCMFVARLYHCQHELFSLVSAIYVLLLDMSEQATEKERPSNRENMEVWCV